MHQRIYALLLLCLMSKLLFSQNFLCQINPNKAQQQSDFQNKDVNKNQVKITLNAKQKETVFKIYDEYETYYTGPADDVLLKPGTYKIMAQCRFYMTEIRNITVKHGPDPTYYFDLAAYQSSIQTKLQSYEYQSWTGVALTALNVLFTIQASKKADDYYDKYDLALNSQAAKDYKDKSKNWDTYTMISGITISLPVSYTIYSYLKYKKLKSLHQDELNLLEDHGGKK